MLETKIEQDIKTALLAGDAERVSVLRGLKSTLLNEKVAKGKRDSGLTDEEVLPILSKEAKKRQESADMYKQGGDETRQQAELSEKAIIEEYLPAQLDEAEVAKIVDEIIKETGAEGQQAMGKVIGAVRTKTTGQADGALIARLTKEKLGL
jgi:uncharacterized protein YqeY